MDEFNKAYKEFIKDVNDSNDLNQDFIDFINDLGFSTFVEIYDCNEGFEKESE